jgi:cytochrome c553
MKPFISLAGKAAVVVAVAAISMAMSGGAMARGNLAAGQAKAKQVCAACHGENGDKSLQPEYPNLAGQHADYIIRALKDYKSGVRKNAIMGAQAQPLSSQDIQDVAAWFASQRGPLHVKH